MPNPQPRARARWALAWIASSIGLTATARADPEAASFAGCREARAVRGLVAPSGTAPVTLEPGEPLWLTVASATGLTPPPGLQEPRAHRGLYVGLCAEGEPAAGGPARLCAPVRVDDFRPCGAHSLLYRVSARPEPWLAPGRYALRVRFPGGEAEAAGAVRLGTPGPRIHVGARGLAALPSGAAVYPAPGSVGGFGPGYVLVLPAGAPTPAQRAHIEPLPFEVRAADAVVAGRLHVSVRGLPSRSRVFVRSELGDLARGAEASLPAGSARELRIAVLSVAPDGRSGRRELVVPVRPALGFGCALGQRAGGAAALGLLALALSATLGRRVGPKRRAAPPPTRE